MARPAVVHNLNCKENYVDAGGMHMSDYSKITALYSRLSVGDEDRDAECVYAGRGCRKKHGGR